MVALGDKDATEASTVKAVSDAIKGVALLFAKEWCSHKALASGTMIVLLVSSVHRGCIVNHISMSKMEIGGLLMRDNASVGWLCLLLMDSFVNLLDIQDMGLSETE